MFKYQDNKFLQDSLIPKMDQMKERLRDIPVENLVKNSGVRLHNGSLLIDVFNKPFEIELYNYSITNQKNELESSLFHCIVFSYLLRSDGTTKSDAWISFRELPDGYKYSTAFQGYAPDRLTQHWSLNVDGFEKACKKANGKKIDLGDSSYKFKVFPNIEIAVLYWIGDDNYPSKASLLFDKNVTHYMITAGIATIGNELVETILGHSDDQGSE